MGTHSYLVGYVQISLRAQDSTLLREIKENEILGIEGGRVINREWEREVCLRVGRENDVVGDAVADGGIVDRVKNLRTD